jgi:hypothetical protein
MTQKPQYFAFHIWLNWSRECEPLWGDVWRLYCLQTLYDALVRHTSPEQVSVGGDERDYREPLYEVL